MATLSDACTSLASLVRTNSGAPSGLSVADCSFIQANSAAICNTLASWDIVNGNGCQQRGPGYGCQFSNTAFSTQDTFYCQTGPVTSATASHSSNPSPSASSSSSASTSPSSSASTSASPSVSTSASPSASSASSSSPIASSSSVASPSSLSTYSATMTGSSTATSTSTHTIKPVYIYVNTTDYVVIKESSIEPGEAAAIGLSSIFGMVLIFFFIIVFRLRRTSQEKPEIPEIPLRRPSTMVIRNPSRRSSTV